MQRLWISVVVIAADQVSKILVAREMFLGESVSVLGSFFKLTYIVNPGAVFGMRLGGQVLHLAFAVAALSLVAFMLYRLQDDERAAGVGLTLVLGGAVGNVIDRLRVGAVIDFLDFGVNGVRWWVFNVADMSVTTGAGLLILSYGFLQTQKDGPDGTGDNPVA